MDWHLYVFSFLAGALGTIGIPHFIKGLSGKKHQTPFGRPSSALVNFLWGWVCLVVAGLLMYWSHFHSHLLRSFACVAIGALIVGIILSLTWSKHPEYNKQ